MEERGGPGVPMVTPLKMVEEGTCYESERERECVCVCVCVCVKEGKCMCLILTEYGTRICCHVNRMNHCVIATALVPTELR